MPEWVAVGLLHGRARRRANVREDGPRRDVIRQLAQVPVVPRGLDAAEDGRRLLLSVPADAEAVAVRLLGAEPRMEALDDQRVLGPVEKLLDGNRRSRVREPATHGGPTFPPEPTKRITRFGRGSAVSPWKEAPPRKPRKELPGWLWPATTRSWTSCGRCSSSSPS